MKKKLLLIPTIVKKRNKLSILVDINLIRFLKKIFTNYDIQIVSDIIDIKQLIVSTGGNTIFQKKKMLPIF